MSSVLPRSGTGQATPDQEGDPFGANAQAGPSRTPPNGVSSSTGLTSSTRRRAPPPLTEDPTHGHASQTEFGVRVPSTGLAPNTSKPSGSFERSTSSTRTPGRASSPRSKSSPTATWTSRDQAGSSPSPRNYSRPIIQRAGSSQEDTTLGRRRRKASQASDGSPSAQRLSPLSPRQTSVKLPDDVEKAGGHAGSTSQMYPGVVLGSYEASDDQPPLDFGVDGMRFDGSMDDIMDLSAAIREEGRRGSGAGQDGATIAPWLNEDFSNQGVKPSSPPAVERQPSIQGGGGIMRETSQRQHSTSLSHFASVPSLPHARNKGTGNDTPPLPPPTSGSGQPSQAYLRTRPSSSSASEAHRVTRGSADSTQTLAATSARKGSSGQSSNDASQQGSRHPSLTDQRNSRIGSTTSYMSGGTTAAGEKKKSFFGGLMKRRTGPSVSSTYDTDEPSRQQRTSGSSMNANAPRSGSASNGRDPPFQSGQGYDAGRRPLSRSQPSFVSDRGISPLHEAAEPEFTLDLNLEDMDGIVDPTVAAMPAAAYRFPSLPQNAPQQPADNPPGSMLLQDALRQTVSLEKPTSGSSGSDASGRPSQAESGRQVVAEAHRQSGEPFQRSDPFSLENKLRTSDDKSYPPPSPPGMSPKHVAPRNQPRRPSQLRNVKTGSVDSEASSGDGAPLQPMAPAWVNYRPADPSMFHDPFGPGLPFPPKPTADSDGGISPSRSEDRSRQASEQTTTDRSRSGPTPDAVPERPSQGSHTGLLGVSAVWAAPESWGVEGESMGDDDGGVSSEDEDWEDPDSENGRSGSPGLNETPVMPATPTLGSLSGKAPPFGHKSMGKEEHTRQGSRPGSGATKGRPRTGNVRPGTAIRPGTAARPGTSGSAHASNLPHMIRIYRADGSYNVMSFPLLTTTGEIINVLSGANEGPSGRKLTTNMRLYLREKGQDRQLLPSERPLAIQDRRLRQAGYTEAEHIEELGKDDLFILCKFIYQTPVLPVMDPEEESSYDSYENIDIAGRDLQTIPIFLHLHAHNVIILNVSRNPMADLPLDFIQACSGLKELRMSYMALKRIPASLCASTTLSRLDVSCNRIADVESIPLHEITTLTSLKVQNNRLSSIPGYFAQLKGLKYLNISNNKFETFPAVVCRMSNLVDLDVSFNEIAEFPPEMSDLKSLDTLAAFGNELTTFPASFSTMSSLRVLDVRRNKLTDLSAIYALPNLTTLQADYNNLVTLDAQLGVRVREFSVPHNSITRFTLAPLPNVAAVTYSLTRLNLSHGKISTLAEEALQGLVNLVELNLDFNQFTSLPSTLGRLVNLEIFSCTDNLLDYLPKGFGRMQKLRTLNVHNNNLKEMPGELWACSSIESINASSNLIKEVGVMPTSEEMMEMLGPSASRKLSITSEDKNVIIAPPAGFSLKHVLLADNQFNEDIFHSIAQLPEIRTLNLSFNDIFEIPPSTLSKCEKMEALYLSGNKLTSLPTEDLERLQKLKVLHLNGNKLQTLPSELAALVALEHLDVGSNVLKYNIANWPYDWNWNWNTALRYLNLSGNKRLEIKPTSAQDMVSHVASFRKDLSDFTALTQLRILGLMDVNLRITSLPDESHEQRVRTSFSDINNMAYGIADMLGAIEHLAMFDLVVPNFRGKPTECLFGMFGRAAPSAPSGKIPKFLQESFAAALVTNLDQLQPGENVTEALRRTFLWSNRAAFTHLSALSEPRRKGSMASYTSGNSIFQGWSATPSADFRTGSSGAVVYLVDRTLHVANVGDCLVVISRKGEAELLSKLHDPTDREETARIRHAEAWVSTKGYVNNEKDVDISRAVGYYQSFPAINASPEVRTRQLAESDEFVIIGSFALWQCCSYQTAVDIARTERSDPMMAAQKLRDFAISYGAEGSVMVMVVNISDLFVGGKLRTRGQPGSGPTANGEIVTEIDTSTFYGREKRVVRRRNEEVGDRTLNRLQQEIEPPLGQIAIVFTDIVNSTSLWESNSAMPTAIKMHHNLMRRQLRLDGGYEVKTEGDSFMVSFQTVTAALLWAFNCQIGLLSQEWPRELLDCPDGKIEYDSEGNLVQRGLRVRMGIHWGSPQCERDPITRRMDYYGPMVNRAARINASADGGQLMASQDVIAEIQTVREYLDAAEEDVASWDLPVEIKREIQELRRIGFDGKDMGERKLKGLEVPEQLHLLYPRALAGRFETSNDLRANVEVGDSRHLHVGARYIDVDNVRELSMLALRLETICSSQQTSVTPSSPPTSPKVQSPRMVNGSLVASPRAEHSPTRNGPSPKSTLTVAPGMEKTHSRKTRKTKLLPDASLGPAIGDDMGDQELLVVIESLSTRIENSMSTLYLSHVGGLSSLLASLEPSHTP